MQKDGNNLAHRGVHSGKLICIEDLDITFFHGMDSNVKEFVKQ